MKSISLACAAVAGAVLALAITPANAGHSCVKKAAVATAPTADQAKWYALETTVQAVSWSLWPGYVATSKVAGYQVKDTYKCAPEGSQTTCHVVATFCKGH